MFHIHGLLYYRPRSDLVLTPISYYPRATSRAHKVVFHTGLSIFKLGSLHGFRLDAWLDSAEHARVARAHSLAADVARSPQGALLSQVPVFPRDEVAVTRSRTTSAKLGQLPSTASAAATSAATVTAVR